MLLLELQLPDVIEIHVVLSNKQEHLFCIYCFLKIEGYIANCILRFLMKDKLQIGYFQLWDSLKLIENQAMERILEET